MNAALVTNIKRKLVEADLSARQASLKSGLGESVISDILSGRVESPRLSTVDALCEVLNCSTSDLLSGASSGYLPPGAKSIWYSTETETDDAPRELMIVFSEVRASRCTPEELAQPVNWRYATDDELREYYRYNPCWVDHAKPHELRNLFEDGDGEIFALFAERHRLIGRQYDYLPTGETIEHPEVTAALAENLTAICRTPAVSDAGNCMKLELLFDHGPRGARVTDLQRSQLLTSVHAWLQWPQMNKRPFETRAIDRVKAADVLLQRETWDRPTDLMLKMTGEYIRACAAYRAIPDPSDETIDFFCEQAGSLEQRISDTKPRSIEGALAGLDYLIDEMVACGTEQRANEHDKRVLAVLRSIRDFLGGPEHRPLSRFTALPTPAPVADLSGTPELAVAAE